MSESTMPVDLRGFEAGDVVAFDHAAYYRLTRPDSALAQLAAKRLPPKVGQVSSVDFPIVEVIWEDGRLGVFAYPQGRTCLKWTSTEVLKL